MQENIKSYNSIYQLRQAFIRSGGHSDSFADGFNRLETPANFYFRIFFHFNTGYGLLNTGDQFIDPNPNRLTYTENTNTATSYLFTNGELQRKQMLDDFVTLLSNINTYSPWYFQSIEGLQEALQHPEYTGEFKIEEEPKSIVIKTLEDSYDNRISTLLDLYKSVAFSKILHKEILPANLRRFDMSLYIINTPIAYVHYGYGDVYSKKLSGLNGSKAVYLPDRGNPEVTFEIPGYREWANGSSDIFSSAKLIEFQGCEIDANSSASAYGEVTTSDPFRMTHDIKITYKNISEYRFNASLNRIIGDYIFMDLDKPDRESEENVWGDGILETYSDEQIAAMAKEVTGTSDTPGELIWKWYDEDNPDNIEGDTEYGYYDIYDETQAAYNDTIDRMMRDSEENISDYNRNISGKIITADDALDPGISDSNKHMLSKYSLSGMARDFISGATETVKNYAESMLNKITMGNLYWGSLSNPQTTIDMNKLGSNLTQMGLDNTVGKGMQRGLGSVKSSMKQAKAAAFGWNTSVGSNLSNNAKSPAIETFGHRP